MPAPITEESTEGFLPTHRVRTHPASDHWMRGERFGVVEKVGKTRVHVRMDASGRLHRLRPQDLIVIS